MRYLIVQEWENTKGNHAGMRHMCDLLKHRFSNKYSIVSRPPTPHQHIYKNRILQYLYYYIYRFEMVLREKKFNYLINRLLKHLTDNDEVFLLEYLSPGVNQYEIAKKIRHSNPNVRIYGLAHHVPLDMLHRFNDKKEEIRKWISVVDMIMTLGSSLSEFLITEIGIAQNKVSTGFHYVDADYYHPTIRTRKNKITILAMGNMQRNYSLLGDIIGNLKDINWIICAGVRMAQIRQYIKDNSNVEIKGFISENELRELMNTSCISLNVMNDTIGSNVITTSMAMGMALVVSDVGSIRDYCDETNAVFCDNTVESFVCGIHNLLNNEQELKAMKQASLEKSKKLTIEYVDNWFNRLREDNIISL